MKRQYIIDVYEGINGEFKVTLQDEPDYEVEEYQFGYLQV